jgi:type IV pilus assembly protein PilB
MEKAYTLRAPTARPTTAMEAVDFIIATALRLKASDIHLSPNTATTELPDRFILRFRVYGKLQVVRATFLANMYNEVIARIKVLAEMSGDGGTPLDGQLVVAHGSQFAVLRISTVPSQGYEELVMRVQKNSNENLSINKLQMTEDMRERLRNVTQQKSGLIVLNGPAGSGKTTTIYSLINSLASPEKKIITVEDPVETRLPYVNHTQVTNKTSFASLSRAFMRQDADVIFLGEIRDEESAQTALQLAQTGHLVLTTLHSRDAIGVVSRLEALGVHPNNIATTLICSLGQRLVPSLCASCKVQTSYDTERLALLDEILEIPADTQFYNAGKGCDQCVKGYSGRIPLFELFVVDAELSDGINQRKSKLELTALARSKGMATMAEEALLRLYYGYTDFDSVKNFVYSLEA